ncbi:MAG: HD family phosphohydrolase [Phycisphaerales bacterium]
MPQDAPKAGFSGVRSRREMFRRPPRTFQSVADFFFRSPTVGWALLIGAAFVLTGTALAAWSRQHALVAVDRVMNITAVVRRPFSLEDSIRTEQARELARAQTPRVYAVIPGKIEALRASIEGLPKTLAGAMNAADVRAEVKAQFPLTDEAVSSIRAEATEDGASAAWVERTGLLAALLARQPFVDDQAMQRELQESLARDIEIRVSDAPSIRIPKEGSIVNIKDEAQLAQAAMRLTREAGFVEPALSVVAGRLRHNPEPTFQLDEAATTRARNVRAEAISPVRTEVPAGQVIFKRGDTLTPQALELYRRDLDVFAEQSESWKVWLRRASLMGGVTAIALAVAGYLALFCPRVRTSPRRMAGVALMLVGGLALSCVGTVANPALLTLTAVAPTVLVSVILVIAYDQRVALALGTLEGVLVCIALDQPIGVYALILTGISFAVFQLREIRDRRGIIRTGLYAAAALSVGTVLVALIDRPISDASLRQTFMDAALAGCGGLGIGVLTLSLLPTLERAFDITTGMTLVELRDPKQPLLRQLQQQAPGTYNHSLNVAAIAEAAADAIRADSLLTYVGALYHDVGKMNKPDYFVENQTGGPSKHDKLSPAMSLLVIVGHVKDGLAMAEEYNLPRSIRHFIEAHHGTTLVEFFYNRARRQAESARTPEAEAPDEVEFRYPGPKPRTKECAILMLADAIESATRTMAEPTPSRIDTLVRAMASKRLMDGQFDDCELTLRELQTITDSISKSVSSIYHGRVLYPSTAGLTAAEEKRA